MSRGEFDKQSLLEVVANYKWACSALENDQFEQFRQVVDEEPALLKVRDAKTGDTLLHKATQLGKKQFILHLRQYDINSELSNIKNFAGKTAEDLLGQQEELRDIGHAKKLAFQFITVNRFDDFKKLLEIYPELVRAQNDETGDSLLHSAIFLKAQNFIDFLIAKKAPLDLKNSMGLRQCTLFSVNSIEADLKQSLI